MENSNIYKTARSIKRKDNNLYNALLSIHHDSIFVSEISQLWALLPLLANLRCGLWYSSHFHSTCYFKSTDGHTNNCSFNTSRLNLHVALLAGEKGGCYIVDSTRKGKMFPDSMSKTIPIWCCVLNRAIYKYRQFHHHFMNVNHYNENDERPKDALIDWDCSLHLPLWVSKTEKASIENRLEYFTALLEGSGADIGSLSASLKKPLRPLWISQKSVIWLNQVPDHDSWTFTPIILVSASSSNGFLPQRTSSEFSWNYIPGAGDDEESWARGLTPILFWNHVYDIINCGPDLCNQKVSEIVEKDRVYRAQRGQDAPQILVKSQQSNGSHDLPLHEEFHNLELCPSASTKGDSGICWLDSTNIAIGTAQLAATKPEVDCILNCGKELLDVNQSYTYLHLPILSSKMDRFSLLNNLPSAMKFARSNLIQGKSLLVCCHDAMKFARSNLIQGKSLLVCCHDGEDISVCVCLAILISFFSEEGSFDDGKSFKETQITKGDLRRRLVFICKFSTNAQPSRGNLRQVFGFLISETGLDT